MLRAPTVGKQNEEVGADMANRPSHGLQERIIAFVASKPNREVSRNGSRESCASWIGKRLDTNEKAVAAELETLERDGRLRLTRGTVDRGIKTVQVVHGVEPEQWAVDEVRAHQDPSEAPQELVLPANLDYRQLGESVLLAALEALSSSDDTKAQYQTYTDQIADLTETNAQLRADLSHVKVERDTNIKGRKVAEQTAHEQKNRADEALAQVAELQADISALEQQVDELKEKLRDANIGRQLVEDLSPDAQASLRRLLEEAR
jgi:prefoldin subunit 5